MEKCFPQFGIANGSCQNQLIANVLKINLKLQTVVHENNTPLLGKKLNLVS